MIFDEYGRPFIILREQQAQARIRGKEAQKVRCVFRDKNFSKISGRNHQVFWLASKRLLGLFLSLPCPPFPAAQRSTRNRTMAMHLFVLALIFRVALKKQPMMGVKFNTARTKSGSKPYPPPPVLGRAAARYITKSAAAQHGIQHHRGYATSLLIRALAWGKVCLY